MGLEIRIAAWRNKQEGVHKYELQRQLKDLKDYPWITDVPRQSLDLTIERLDNSYKKFFTGARFPRFASKRFYKSIQFKQEDNILRVDGCKINLPKLSWIKMFKDSPITGAIKTASIIKEPTGYFICIVTGAVKSIQNQNESQILGIDMGVAVFATDSNGGKIENPKHFKRYERKLRIENRSLARKKKGSNSWKRQAKRLPLLHHKIGNVRRDFLHKESTKIAKANNTVILEDLNVAGMVKSRLSKSISDAGWAAFRTMLTYKTNVVSIDPKFTSQTCNDCGTKDSKSRLSQSKFVCTACGVESNADENAAKNIRDKGIVIIRQRGSLERA